MLRTLADWGERNGLLLNGEHLQTSVPLAGFTEIQVRRVPWDIGDWRGGIFLYLLFSPFRVIPNSLVYAMSWIFVKLGLLPRTLIRVLW